MLVMLLVACWVRTALECGCPALYAYQVLSECTCVDLDARSTLVTHLLLADLDLEADSILGPTLQ
jgi:hypothetical protein